jgi:lysophospholipase L1-like esterase
MRKMVKFSICALALVAAFPVAAQPPIPVPAAKPLPSDAGRILLAGDSTMQTYDEPRYPQGGWGQFLGCGLKNGAVVINRAIGGRSTKSFIAEGRWDRMMSEVRPGDTVIVQFGHNDATKAKPERYADPAMFRDNLLRFVWESRGHGAYPVLVTPVARRSFDAEGKARADFAEYSAVTREVAALTATPLIDLEGASRNLLDKIGPERAKALYMNLEPGAFPNMPQGLKDDTHFNELGARVMADLVAEQLAGLGVPSAQLVMAQRPDLTRKKMLGSQACH